jgi:hypothetical protein
MFIAGDLDATARNDAMALFDAMPTRGVLHTLISVPGRADSGVNLLADTVPNGRSRGDTVHAQIELGKLTPSAAAKVCDAVMRSAHEPS